MRSILLILCLTATALAGCADSGSAEAGDDSPTIDPEKPLDAGKGLIRGVTVTALLEPIPNATVKVIGSTLETTSNHEGAFLFNNMEPGPYLLTASKAGYNTVQGSAEVTANDDAPAIVKIYMTEDPESLPYYIPFYKELFVSCSFKAANYVFDASWCDPYGATGYSTSDESMVAFATGTTDNATWLQTELEWEATQEASIGFVSIQCAAPDTDGSHCNSGEPEKTRLCAVDGASPLICRIGTEGAQPGGGHNLKEVRAGDGFAGEFAIQVYADCAAMCVPGTILGAGVSIEQTVYAYAHVFYNYAPPEDWSFIESNSVPPPS